MRTRGRGWYFGGLRWRASRGTEAGLVAEKGAKKLRAENLPGLHCTNKCGRIFERDWLNGSL